jgi:ketosteroid isomerase-like protein
VFDDRRRSTLLTGDRDMAIANSRFVASQGVRTTRTLLATAGDRLALEHLLYWAGAADAPDLEVEALCIAEVDAEGRVIATISFDPEDRNAAFAEAQARFAAGEAAAIGGQAPIAALVRALGQHDWESLRGALAPDAAICDRRALAIMGEFDREQWVDSLRTLADLAPDMNWELFRILAWNRHGRVGAGRLFGSTRDGGPFENPFIAVLLTRDEHVQRYEFFDVGDAGRAIARFEELCKA